MTPRPPRLAVAALVAVLTACAPPDARPSDPSPAPPPSSPSATEPSSTASPSPGPAPSSSPPAGPASPDPGPGKNAAPRRTRGIDVSHHQGRIDWTAVAEDDIAFAYVKGSEGSTWTDPAFATNAREASEAGLDVGAYHWFSTCSPGAPQGEHYAAVLAQTPVLSLPPAVDLEIDGNCATPPDRPTLIAEVRAFLRVVERRTGERVVVYAFPDFEARYRLSETIDRPQWVRRLGNQAPGRDWWIWQRSQTGVVDGVGGPVDLNVMQAR